MRMGNKIFRNVNPTKVDYVGVGTKFVHKVSDENGVYDELNYMIIRLRLNHVCLLCLDGHNQVDTYRTYSGIDSIEVLDPHKLSREEFAELTKLIPNEGIVFL